MFFDYHVHSDLSLDSEATMWEMVIATAKMGMDQMCFTNHCDLVDWADMQKVKKRPIIPEQTMEKYAQMVEQFGPPPIDVRLGIELGEALFDPEMAISMANTEGLDFVMGSLHIMQGLGDFCLIKYTSVKQCYDLYEQYMDELIAIARLDFFDVMAHVGYCHRYMIRYGFDIKLTLDRYGDKVEELFKILIGNGRGIEINCSGLRDGIDPFPNEPVLRLYRALGGEVLTIGSDAHAPQDAGKCVREGIELARACGFKYITTYNKRKPSFEKI